MSHPLWRIRLDPAPDALSPSIQERCEPQQAATIWHRDHLGSLPTQKHRRLWHLPAIHLRPYSRLGGLVVETPVLTRHGVIYVADRQQLALGIGAKHVNGSPEVHGSTLLILCNVTSD